MPISMQIPIEFLTRIQTGELIRYGAIIKDALSGQIVGHLKETGNLGQILNSLPLDPITGALNLAASGLQGFQLRQISQALDVLQLTAGVGAAASIVNLGISIAGFAIVMNKCNRIESKLDHVLAGLDEIRSILDEQNIQLEMIKFSKLMAAATQLRKAECATTDSRMSELLKLANADFSKLRISYFNSINSLSPESNLLLEKKVIQELFERYFIAAQGELHSEFMLNDRGAYRETLKSIQGDSLKINSFEITDVYRNRCDMRKPQAIDFDFNGVMNDVKDLKSYTMESFERIDSFNVELEYIECNNIRSTDYIETLKGMEPNIVLIPHHGA